MALLHTLYINIVPFVVILSFLVFVHELGHYLVAKYNGVKVEVFSIGFGREIFGWTDRSGTRWKFSWIPLGGYVRMFSDANAASQPDASAIAHMTEEEKKQSLFHKTVGQRMAVSAAGPFANYILAILLFAALYSFYGQRIPSSVAKIGYVMEKSAAAEAGLQKDDVVTHVDGKSIGTFSDLYDAILTSPDRDLTLSVERKEEALTLMARPLSTELGGKKVGKLGIQQGFDIVKISSPLTAMVMATREVFNVSWSTLKSMGGMIFNKQSAEGLSGPLGIASVIGQFAQKDISDLLWITAFLSLNLGLINLFPVPMLDGGHLLFYGIEAIRGRPVSEKIQEYGYRVGFALLMGLFLYSTWNDLMRMKAFTMLQNGFDVIKSWF